MASTKAEYLKRYLLESKSEKKKTKKVSKTSGRLQGLKILDDDVDIKTLLPKNVKTDLYDDLCENKPTVVDLELSKRMQGREWMKNKNNWKTVGEEEEENSVKDISPRKRRCDSTDSDEAASPHKKVNDVSPPCKKQRQNDSDSDRSPRKTTKLEDMSPPRKRQGRNDSDSDETPPRKTAKMEDMSPPRKRQVRNDSDSDKSPLRRTAKMEDMSPPRKRQGRNNYDSDESPPRKTAKMEDISPPRKRQGRNNSDSDKSPPRRKTEGGDSEAPRVVHRMKGGKKRDLVAEQRLKDNEEAKKTTMAAKYQEWNKGLKQKEFTEQQMADALHEVVKPLARYRDDKDLDAQLRERVREDDPLASFIKPKTGSKGGVRPRYRGPQPPPNRFNLEPGYRWDGVDRSNGFEKKIFAKIAEDKARRDIAHKWSVEDM